MAKSVAESRAAESIVTNYGLNHGHIIGINQGTVNIGALGVKGGDFLEALYLTDPQVDKSRIKNAKGDLLVDSCKWLLDHVDFCRWYNDDNVRLLWLKGDPGKGKTMLMIGVIEELDKRTQRPKESERNQSERNGLLCYYFFEGTYAIQSDAVSMLRSIIWLLIRQENSLQEPFRIMYERYGSKLFKGRNVFTALSEVLDSIVQRVSPAPIYFIIDALDECKSGFTEMAGLIDRHSSQHAYKHVKWIISSRNEHGIEAILRPQSSWVHLSLEQNGEAVSQNVYGYIDDRLQKLPPLQEEDELFIRIRESMRQKSGGTFLWVTIVMEKLKRVETDFLHALESTPQGLQGLYDQMMDKVKDNETSLQALSIVLLALRPLHPLELAMLLGLSGTISDHLEKVKKIVSGCGSFLSWREDKLHIIHESAKEYLTGNTILFPSGQGVQHAVIFRKTIDAMKDVLRENIYHVRDKDDFPQYGLLVNEISIPVPDPLVPVRYACTHWIDHLEEAHIQNEIDDGGVFSSFLQVYFVYWLEALSLMRVAEVAARSFQRLERLLVHLDKRSQLLHLTLDIHRFLSYYGWMIEYHPLQLYVSAPIFTPTKSSTRMLLKDHTRDWILTPPVVTERWRSTERTIPFRSPGAFSHNGGLFVSFYFGDVRIHNTTTWGEVCGWRVCSPMRTGYERPKSIVSFSHDDATVAVSITDTRENVIEIRDISSADRTMKRLECDSPIAAMEFSPDGSYLASATESRNLTLYDTKRWQPVSTQNLQLWVSSMAFSPDGALVALGGEKLCILMVNQTVATLDLLCQMEDTAVIAVTFSIEGRTIFAVFRSGEVLAFKLTQVAERQWRIARQVISSAPDDVRSAAFSPGGLLVAVQYVDRLKVWELESGRAHLDIILETHSDGLAFSPDAKRLACGRLYIFDLTADSAAIPPKEKPGVIKFSPDGSHVVSYDGYSRVDLWNATTGNQKVVLRQPKVNGLQFTADGNVLATWFPQPSVFGFASSYARIIDISTWKPKGSWLGNLLRPASPGKVILHWSESRPEDVPWKTTWGINQTMEWITRNGHDVLWLPREYRPRWWEGVAWSPMPPGSGAQGVAFFAWGEKPLVMRFIEPIATIQSTYPEEKKWERPGYFWVGMDVTMQPLDKIRGNFSGS